MHKTVKTTINLPAKIFQRAEALCQESGKSRNELYAEALEAYFSSQEIREMQARSAGDELSLPDDSLEVAGITGSSFSKAQDW